jgi:hypothetical protein
VLLGSVSVQITGGDRYPEQEYGRKQVQRSRNSVGGRDDPAREWRTCVVGLSAVPLVLLLFLPFGINKLASVFAAVVDFPQGKAI